MTDGPSPLVADERLQLESMVNAQRLNVVELLAGVDEQAARARLVGSDTTLLGLVKHATFVEQAWFHARVAGRTRADVGMPEDPAASFILADDDTAASVIQRFQAAWEGSIAIAAGVGLDDQFDWRGTPVNLRWIYLHLVQEYARHCGHGDIIREQLADGPGPDLMGLDAGS